jgi:hypothetical protein
MQKYPIGTEPHLLSIKHYRLTVVDTTNYLANTFYNGLDISKDNTVIVTGGSNQTLRIHYLIAGAYLLTPNYTIRLNESGVSVPLPITNLVINSTAKRILVGITRVNLNCLFTFDYNIATSTWDLVTTIYNFPGVYTISQTPDSSYAMMVVGKTATQLTLNTSNVFSIGQVTVERSFRKGILSTDALRMVLIEFNNNEVYIYDRTSTTTLFSMTQGIIYTNGTTAWDIFLSDDKTRLIISWSNT